MSDPSDPTEGADPDRPEVGVADAPEGVRRSHVVHGSVWLFAVLGTQSAVSFVFLFLAARRLPADDIGVATALFVGLQFVNFLTSLGLDVALARFGSRPTEEADRLFGWAVVATVVSSTIGSVAYLAIVATSATDLLRTPAGVLCFALLAIGTATHSLVDVRLMAARRWGWMLAKMSLLGVIRLVLLYVPAPVDEGLWVLLLLAGPTAIAGFVGVFLLPTAEAGRTSFKRPRELAEASRYAGVNWVAAVAFGAPQFTLPIIVANNVTEQAQANFYLAWSFTAPVFFIPAAIHQVLLLEGSKADDEDDEAAARKRSREAMALAAGLALAAFVVSLLFAPIIPKIYGEDYHEAAYLLPRLMLGAVPWAVSTIRLAEARLRRDHVSTVAITLTFGLGVLGLALALVPGRGTDGAVQAWLIGNGLAAIISIVFGGVRGRRTARRDRLAAAG